VVESLYTLPGWVFDSVRYKEGVLTVSVKSLGSRTNMLFNWVAQHGGTVQIQSNGFYILFKLNALKRQPPTVIYPLQNVIATMIDRLSYVMPGNNLAISAFNDRRVFVDTVLTIEFESISPTTLALISKQLKDLPLVLANVSMKAASNGTLTGSLALKALGS
jgi:hypothetical protein